MKTSSKSPLRQQFIQHLTLSGKAKRTIQAYVAQIADLARYHRQSPDQLQPEQVQQWLYHLITERKYSASSVNIAVNALCSFYRNLLGRDLAPFLRGVVRPARKRLMPRVYSPAEIERLLRVGVSHCRDQAFLMTVYGCGLRLSEATHIQIKDLDGARHQLLVSHPKGGHQRYTLLSDNLLQHLRTYWRKEHPPGPWLFPGIPRTEPMHKSTGQGIFYRAVRKAGLPDKGGIHGLRHSFATTLLENKVEITVVQKLLGHANLSTTALYLHVRRERLEQIQSPLGLLDLSSSLLR